MNTLEIISYMIASRDYFQQLLHQRGKSWSRHQRGQRGRPALYMEKETLLCQRGETSGLHHASLMREPAKPVRFSARGGDRHMACFPLSQSRRFAAGSFGLKGTTTGSLLQV